MNPKDFAPEIVFVRGGFLGVPGRTAWLLIQRSEPIRIEWIGIIAGRDVKVPIGMHEQRAGGVTTLIALRGNPEQDLFRRQIQGVAHYGESRHVLFRNGAGRRVKQIKPVIRQKTIIERDTEQTVFDLGFDSDVAGDKNRIGLWFPDFDVAGAFDIENSPIRRHCQFEWIAGAIIQNHFLVIRVNGRAGVGRFDTCGELDSAKQVGLKQRLGKALGCVAPGGVPRPAAVVNL